MKGARRERPGQPGETAAFCCGCNPFAFPFCRESREGAAHWDGCPKRGQEREKARKGFAYPEEKRCCWRPWSQRAPPPLPLATPGASSEKQTQENPNKINSLLLHQNTFRKQQREMGVGRETMLFYFKACILNPSVLLGSVIKNYLSYPRTAHLISLV